MAEPILLAALTDLKTLLDGEPVSDAALTLALQRASDRFRGLVGHPVHLVTAERIWLGGDGTAVLLLPAAPVTDITVTVDGRQLTPADFEIARRHGILRRKGGQAWPRGLDNIEIVYSHGYETIPGMIADAVLEHAATLALVHAHVQQESAGSISASYGAAATIGTTQKWADAVNAYRLRGQV
jgi:hypothetical protein